MTFDWSVVWDNRERLFDGARLTVVLTVNHNGDSAAGGHHFSHCFGSSPFRPVRGAAQTGFVEFFRATPLILQIYWISFYVLPAALDIRLSEFATALLGLSLNVSAFNSETFRAGIQSIRPGQWNAGLGLGNRLKPEVFLKIVLLCAATSVCCRRSRAPGPRSSRIRSSSRSLRSPISVTSR